MKKFAFTALILCFLIPTANAQENQYKGGMKYTTLRKIHSQDHTKKALYNRKATTPFPEESPLKKETNGDSALPKAPDEAEIVKTPEDSVWEKYKALAAGKTENEDNKDTLVKPEKPETPAAKTAEMKQKENARPGGMAGIIADYQRNKQKRSQMRSINIARPSKPEADAPSVDKPSVKAPKVEN